jgi:hypothetical protein
MSEGAFQEVLQKSEDAVVGEAPIFCQDWRKPPSPQRFCQNCVRGCNVDAVALRRTRSIPSSMSCRLAVVLSEGVCHPSGRCSSVGVMTR